MKQVFNMHCNLQAALVGGESMLTFGFAAVALELAFRSGQLKPFGFSTSQADV